MEKKSHPNPVHSGEPNTGCIWSLISMLYFRQGLPTPKLLSEGRYTGWRHAGSGYSGSKLDLLSNFELINEKNSGREMASIRTLMEEEMSRANHSEKISDSKLNWQRSNLVDGVNLEYNHKHSGCKTMIDQCPSINSTDYRKHHDKSFVHPAQSHSVVQEVQCVADAITNRSPDAQKLPPKGKVYQSQEFMTALKILNSNKELFVKLLEDPNSLLLRHIQDLQNAHSGIICESEACKQIEGSELLAEVIERLQQYKEPIDHKLLKKQNEEQLFGEKDRAKAQSIKTKKDRFQPINKTVILRPSTSSIENSSRKVGPRLPIPLNDNSKHPNGSERVPFYFSLKEIRRKLRYTFRESRPQRYSMSMDGVQNSSDKTVDSSLPHKSSKYNSHSAKKDDRTKPKQGMANKYEIAPFEDGDQKKLNMLKAVRHLYKHSLVYKEAKYHLTEMAGKGNENKPTSTKQAVKSLEVLLHVHEHDSLSPKSGPRITDVPNALCQEESAMNDLDDPSCSSSRVDDAPQELESDRIQVQGCCCPGEYFDIEGNMEIIDTADIICLKEQDLLAKQSELNSNEPNIESKMTKLSPYEVNTQPITPPRSLVIQKLEVTNNFMEKPERPSPVSVLDPFFSEDTISPVSCEQAEPRQIYFEKCDHSEEILSSSNPEAHPTTCANDWEVRFQYVRTVLEASGLCFDGVSKRWISSDELLDPFLFDELEITSKQLQDDTKLIFDCIGEVLVDIQERLLNHTPWMLIIRPSIRPVPLGKNLIQEVWKGIEKYSYSKFPTTLDQLVGKDTDSKSWLNIHFETEGIIFRTGDAILEDLIEEIIISCGVELPFLLEDLFHS